MDSRTQPATVGPKTPVKNVTKLMKEAQMKGWVCGGTASSLCKLWVKRLEPLWENRNADQRLYLF